MTEDCIHTFLSANFIPGMSRDHFWREVKANCRSDPIRNPIRSDPSNPIRVLSTAICTCGTHFCLSLSLFCTTTTLFCTTKTSNFLVTHYFYGGIVVCAYPIFCFLCSCSLLFFTGPHLHLADCSVLAASNSHFLTVSLNFHVFLPTKFVSLALALSLLST